MNIELRQPTSSEFSYLENYIRIYELDNRALNVAQFVAAFEQNKLLGFGRLRKHNDCVELCSLGVVAPYRRKGIGKRIVNELLKQTSESVYLVCVIPEYFFSFDFVVVDTYPNVLQDKLDFCTNNLIVEEKYVVMKKEN
jgi:N-acetylglutamate synthase-like GNAT family acetyltransferase